MKSSIGILVVCATVLCTERTTFATDQAAIEKAIESYTAAFNARDAKSLAAHWSSEAVYINPITGDRVEGREAIAKEFEAILAELEQTELVIAGSVTNTETDNVQAIEGMIDTKTQRSAWVVTKKDSPIMETGIANLTKDEAPALLHFADGQTQQWLLVRLEEPEGEAGSS